jgi:predicted negative regulator of RcsB-dependent stress response
VITGVLFGLALLFAGKAWFAYQERNAEEASAYYAQMMEALRSHDLAKVDERGSAIIGNYSSTPYAVMSAFALAKIRLEQGETGAAIAQLKWAMEHAGSSGIRHTARLRLARVMLAEGDTAGALALIDQAGDPGGYSSLYEELRGDTYLAEGRREQAHAAYVRALAQLPEAAANRALLQTKIDDLGTGGSGADVQ